MHAKSGCLDKIVLPIALEWYMTMGCNLTCRYCRQHETRYQKKNHTAITEKIIRLAPKHLWIGGGEPGLVHELPQIAKKIKENINVTIGLSTNLTMPDTIIETLPYVDDLIVSIDTADNDICRKFRGVMPSDIIGNVRKLHEAKNKSAQKVNITVNSVVYKEMLSNDGLEKLNNILCDINPNISHLMCPLNPHTLEGSIIGDKAETAKLFGLVEKLRNTGRNIMLDFPVRDGERTFSKDLKRCYRRYFRLEMSEDGEIYSPCKDAPVHDPVCEVSCNCAAFIDDILFVGDNTKLKGSPVKNRFNGEEISTLYGFIKTNVNSDISEEYLRNLSVVG